MNIHHVCRADHPSVTPSPAGSFADAHKLALKTIAAKLREDGHALEVDDIREWHEGDEPSKRRKMLTYIYGEPMTILKVLAFERVKLMWVQVVERGDAVTQQPAIYRLKLISQLGPEGFINHRAPYHLIVIDVSCNLR